MLCKRTTSFRKKIENVPVNVLRMENSVIDIHEIISKIESSFTKVSYDKSM